MFWRVVWRSLFGAAAGCGAGDVRWAGTSNRLYVGGADTVCTIAELDALVPAAQITPVNAAQTVWLVGSNIVLDGGARLNIHGPAIEELRLKSNNSAGGIVYLRADAGTIDIRDTRVISWDEAAAGPDTEYGAWQRAHIQARSKLSAGTALESTMNIINSDVGYLGWPGAEAYGLSWKVNGSQPGLYETVGVFGEVRGRRIHHNYFGMYTFGAEAMTWTDNEIDNNVLYGLDPHDDSDRLVIERNDVHDNGSHGIICSQRCDHLRIADNRSHHNKGNGIMLHRNTNDSVVEDNEVYNNTDSGLALFESHRNELRRNVATDNGNGIRLSVGSAENIVEDNSFLDSAKYGIYAYKGSDAPTAGDGRPARNRFADNVIRGSAVNGLKLAQSDENALTGNEFTDNGKELRFEDARRNRFEDNTVTGNSALGLLLDRGSVGNEVIDNTITDNGQIGVSVRGGSAGTVLSGNTIREHGQLGVLVYGSAEVALTENIVAANERGVDVRTGDRVRLEKNEIIDNDEYPVLLRRVQDGELVANTITGNGRNYIYDIEQAAAMIEIAGEEPVAVRVKDVASRLTVADAASRVLHNNRGAATTARPERSELVVTSAVSSDVVTVTPGAITAVPDSGTVAISLTADGWTAMASADGIALDYEVGGLTPGATYDVIKNGAVLVDDAVADGGGAVSFSDTLADTSEVEFEVRE